VRRLREEARLGLATLAKQVSRLARQPSSGVPNPDPTKFAAATA
jgi:hypothetical protein